jgi:hypothetical protein
MTARARRRAAADRVQPSRAAPISAFDVRTFGAVGDGVTDDRAAITEAITAAASEGGYVYFPPGSYLVGSTIALPANASLVGASRLQSAILLGFNGDLFTVDDDNRFEKLTFDGQGELLNEEDEPLYPNGRLFTVSGTKARTHWDDCAIVNSCGYCVEWVHATAGSQSSMVNCRVYRFGGDYAMKIEDVENLGAVPKKFIACESDGGKFIDLGGSNDTHIIGGYIAGVRFSTHTSGCIVSCRLADPDGTTLDGSNNSITSDIGGPEGGPCLTVAATARGCNVRSIFNSANPVLDESTAEGVNANQVDVPLSTWTPTVTSSGAAVNLGAGAALTGSYTRSGASVTATIELTFGGAGLSVPVGFLEFSLPATIRPRTASIATRMGSGYAQQGGTTKLLHAVAFPPPTTYVRAVSEGGGFCTNINPFVWATGDVIRLSITYSL